MSGFDIHVCGNGIRKGTVKNPFLGLDVQGLLFCNSSVLVLNSDGNLDRCVSEEQADEWVRNGEGVYLSHCPASIQLLK